MRFAISAVLILACALPAAADTPVGVIRVSATYPGADARTVDETVLIPLFEQINGVEGATRIESEARNDGTGTLTVYFEPKTDLNLAQMLVQNRASLAVPVIPEPCRRLGISVRKLPAGSSRFWLILTSADKDHDAAFLTLYATVHLKDELARIPGVADVRVVGAGEPGVRVWVNPDRLAAYRVTTGDVVESLRRQNAGGAAAGGVGEGAVRSTVTATGRLTDIDQFASAILRAGPSGEVLRLRDVARIEFGPAAGGFARFNGKPAALIAITAWPGRVTLERLLKIEAADNLPPGVRLDLVADQPIDRLLEVALRLPDSTALERTEKVVGRATELIRGLPGEPETTAFAESRSPNTATIFVKVPAKGGPTAAEIEKMLAGIPDATIRVGEVPPGGEAFPVRFALTAPGERDLDQLPEVADRVVAQLMRDQGVAHPAAFPGPAASYFAVSVDRDKCAVRGVELDDVFTTLQTALGGVHATDFSKFGKTWQVSVQTEPKFIRRIEDLTQLRARSAAGELIPLERVLTVRKALAPPALVRVNGHRAVIVTAAPSAGKTPAESATQCVKLTQEVLPRGYRVKDLTGAQR
jgi:multidrug efflux pump subunit AcrB